MVILVLLSHLVAIGAIKLGVLESAMRSPLMSMTSGQEEKRIAGSYTIQHL